jgi:hypothetical protein
MATKPKTEITESDLKKLGFKKIKVPTTASYPDPPYHYYTYEPFKNSVICLITNDSEQAHKKGWVVSFFEEPRFTIKDVPNLKRLIDNLEDIKSIVKPKKTK